jgi:hypothetical protein
MPRPVRRKVNSARPKAEAITANAAKPTSALLTEAAAAKPGGSSSDIYDLSDREKERRHLRRLPVQNGATAIAPARSSPRLAAHVNTHHRTALVKAREKRDVGVERPPAASTNDIDDSVSSVELSRRVDVAATRAGDLTGFDLDDETFGKLDSSFNANSALDLDLDLDANDEGEDVDEEHHSSHARGRTARSANASSSSFNVALFKRGRHRTSSIVGRDDAPIRPSSRGPCTPLLSSTLNFGNFRRRQREPSILGRRDEVGHRASSQVSSRVPSEAGDVELGEDLAPDAEGTPLTTHRTRSRARTSSASTRASAKVTSKKRKSFEDQAGQSKRRAVEGINDAADGAPDIRESIETEHNMSPAVEPATQLPSTPTRDDTALAPPASSGSSNASSLMWPPLKSLARNHNTRRNVPTRRVGTPQPIIVDDVSSNFSSPPSLTHSPNYRDAKPGGKSIARSARHRKPSPKVTTEVLTSLLPLRRRRQQNDPFSIGSSSDTEEAPVQHADDDELAHASRAHTRRAVKPLDAKSKTVKQSKLAAAKTAASEKQQRPSRRTTRRTYGSRSSDKENQGSDDDGDEEGAGAGETTFVPLADDAFDATEDSIVMTARLGEELKNAARKFKEVDQWELSFEEMVDQPSSPKDAR